MLPVADSSTLVPGRKSYARIVEKREIPDLIELQVRSFEWFVQKGLRELFDEISPIRDFTAKVMELQFLDYEFGDPKYSELECRTRDLTFSRPLYVQVELLIKETGEIQRQRVYMGDYPWMTHLGTFIINGAERVIVSQLHRSPGVDFDGIDGKPVTLVALLARLFAQIDEASGGRVIAGWKSADGQLHDYWFTFVNGVAATYGLLDARDANLIMDRLLSKMTQGLFHSNQTDAVLE